jgi:EmrB/QacA subfamily drug resistance transporter
VESALDATVAPAVARPNVVLAVVCFSQLLLSIDVTIVAVANPTIADALGFGDASLQWTITAYALTFGGLLLLGGRIADLYDRRTLFVTGIGGFTIASAIAAAAQSPEQLIVARALQGMCAAMISPCTLSILTSTFEDGPRRRRAYGIWAATGSIGGAVGFLLGGLLTSGFGWRSIFLINVPVGIAAIGCALRWLPHSPGWADRPRLDVPGAITVTAAAALVIFGVSEAEGHGWHAPVTWAPIAVGLGLALLFAWIERRSEEPLVPFRLLRRRGSRALLPMVMVSVMSNGFVYLSALFLQDVLGYSAGQSGAAVLGMPVGFALGTNASSWLGDRLRVRTQCLCGFLSIGLASVWLAHGSDHAPYLTTVLPGTFLAGLGFGLPLVVSISVLMSGVDERDQGIVAGASGMTQQLGGAIGLAALASIAAGGGGEPHAIRVALVVTGALAIVVAVAAFAVLPDRTGAPDQ